MGQEIQRKRKEPTERRTTQRFPMLVPKTDPGELSVNSWKCHYYTLIESRNQRAAKSIDCAMLNETQESCNNSAKNFSTHESIQKRQRKGPRPKNTKVFSCLVNGMGMSIVFNFYLLSTSTTLTTQ